MEEMQLTPQGGNHLPVIRRSGAHGEKARGLCSIFLFASPLPG
jgi:hypothetical protein